MCQLIINSTNLFISKAFKSVLYAEASKSDDLTIILVLSGSAGVKAAFKKLMKLTPDVLMRTKKYQFINLTNLFM